MAKFYLVLSLSFLLTSCGSSASQTATKDRSNAKTNVIAPPYSRSENAYSTASNSSLGNFMNDVGKTATEIKLWEHKEIGARLQKLMGADYAKMKKFWNVETPIKKFGDFIMMTGCEQRNCGDNKYLIFMDKSEGNINVVHIDKGKTKVWKEYGEIDLPPPFAEELAALKSDN